MKILRAIGAFFAKIGRWIKDTAWVQPLLIVGGIFAIIFSIKPISDAFANMFKPGVASEDFYYSFRLSLEGAENNNSSADALFKRIEANELNDDEKFYVSFVSKGCDNCDACYLGFKLFQENFGGPAFEVEDDYKGQGFKLYTIFCDERNKDGDLLIDDFLRNHSTYFVDMLEALNNNVDNQTYNYYVNTKEKATFTANVKSFFECIGADEDEDNVAMPTPTTILFDATAGGVSEVFNGKYATEVFFNFTVDVTDSSDPYKKAYFLRDSWNYTGKFSEERTDN